MENKENVSVNSVSHNRGINDLQIFDPDIKGCYRVNPFLELRFCYQCKVGICPDFYPCLLYMSDYFKPLFYDDRDSFFTPRLKQSLVVD